MSYVTVEITVASCAVIHSYCEQMVNAADAFHSVSISSTVPTCHRFEYLMMKYEFIYDMRLYSGCALFMYSCVESRNEILQRNLNSQRFSSTVVNAHSLSTKN